MTQFRTKGVGAGRTVYPIDAIRRAKRAKVVKFLREIRADTVPVAVWQRFDKGDQLHRIESILIKDETNSEGTRIIERLEAEAHIDIDWSGFSPKVVVRYTEGWIQTKYYPEGKEPFNGLNTLNTVRLSRAGAVYKIIRDEDIPDNVTRDIHGNIISGSTRAQALFAKRYRDKAQRYINKIWSVPTRKLAEGESQISLDEEMEKALG